MPTDNKYANMEEKLRILEDLNMMYIRQIALSLQVMYPTHVVPRQDYKYYCPKTLHVAPH